jgi:membrane associated rhomboid family serine protease
MVTPSHMGIADQNPHRYGSHPGGGFLSQLTPVVKWILAINIGIYFLDLFLKGDAVDGPLREFGAFTIASAVFQFQIWEFVTFQFLHGSLGHLLFNSIGLFFFGPWLERWWGARKFTIYYFLCGVAGAAFFTLLVMSGILSRDSLHSGLIGASAGIYGILIGVAVIAPDLRVALLFPPIELSMRQLAIALMVISIGAILLKFGGNEGGEAGHLGGAILGFILMRYPHLLGGTSRIRNLNGKSRPPQPPKLRPRSSLEREEESAVDLILDKISREGFQSLTQEEREILQKAANRE